MAKTDVWVSLNHYPNRQRTCKRHCADDAWPALWKELQRIGWTYKRGQGLIDWYYLRYYYPCCRPGERRSILLLRCHFSSSLIKQMLAMPHQLVLFIFLSKSFSEIESEAL